jgi:two-component system sensor histidine kinase DesK
VTSPTVARRRTDPERFDLYTRWSLYLLLGTSPLLAVAAVADVAFPEPVVAMLAATMVQAGVAIAVTAAGLRQFLGGTRVHPGLLVTLGVVTAVAAGVAAFAIPPGEGLAGRTGALLVALAVAVVAVAPITRTGVLAVAGLAVAGIVAVSGALPAPAGTVPTGMHPLPAVITTVLLVGSMAGSFRISAWMLGVVWEQERTRVVHARLAVAEERLRFSRDLHDVVGRALSAIALKSELGAELARRGQPGAVDEMLEVRALAQESLREVRAVVAGYRAVDLAAELDGARSVLRAAGVSTRVLGEGTSLPPPVQEALAWVVREAVTNVVRHARASTCTIDLDVLPGGVARLRVVNDGAAAAAGPDTGSGLIGLRERLGAVGGELVTSHERGTFTLTATVPVGPGDGGPARDADAGRTAAPPQEGRTGR